MKTSSTPSKWSEMENKYMKKEEIEIKNHRETNGKAKKLWESVLSYSLSELIENLTVLKTELISYFDAATTNLVFRAKSIPVALNLYLPTGLKKMQNSLIVGAKSERGDVPGWVLVVLMTTGLVTGIWTVAQPRLSSILKNSLDNMNSIR
jgi:hypothetical protein